MLALLYYLIAKTGGGLPLAGHTPSLFWPSSGLTLAALLLFGSQLWPGVLLGSFLIQIGVGLPLLAMVGISLGSAAGAWLGVYLLHRNSFNANLLTVHDILHLLIWGAGFSTFFCAANGTFWLAQQNFISWQLYADTFAYWWMSNILGVVIFTPVLIGLFRPSTFKWTERACMMAILLATTLLLLCLMVFSDFGTNLFGYQIPIYLFIPLIVSAALYFDFRVMSLALLMVYLSTLFSMGGEAGIFSRNTLAEAVDVWMFNVMLGMMGWIVLGVHTQRGRDHKDTSQQDFFGFSNLDALTGLPNHSLLYDRISQMLATAHRDNQKFALLYFDLELFNHPNHLLQLDVRDKLRQIVATRLNKGVRQVDTVSRVGVDEFILLLREADADDAALVVRRLLNSLFGPSNTDTTQLPTNAKIGMSVYPDDAEEAETLIKHAKMAIYHTMKMGQNLHAHAGV